MKELAFAIAGSWLYFAILLILVSHLPAWVFTFVIGYLFVSTFDLWRCWRAVCWARARRLELVLAIFLLFPLGSMLWLPWDIHRAFFARDLRPQR